MKNLTKKQKIDKILNLIRRMEQNTFLLPDSWSSVVDMITRSAHYKTYVSHRGDSERYINIEYTKNNELHNPKQEDCYSIEIRKNNIYINKRLGEVKNEVNLVFDIVEAIYKEKYSFEIMDKTVAEKRKEMKELRGRIKENTRTFNKIKKELDDSKTLIPINKK